MDIRRRTRNNRETARGVRCSAATLVLLIVAAAAAPTGTGAAPLPAPGQPLPDLTVGRAMLRSSFNVRHRKAKRKSCTVKEQCVGGVGRRRTLEFDTQIINRGPGDVLLGAPQDRPNLFEFSQCHGHYHMKGALEYSLSHGGTDTGGLYDPLTGIVTLRNANSDGPSDVSVAFGPTGEGLQAIAGDWDGDGDSTLGVYDPATGTFHLAQENENGTDATTFAFGATTGTLLAVAGDWDGDGEDSVGLFDPATGTFTLRNDNGSGPADFTFSIGLSGADWYPMAGDWNGDDIDTVGLYGTTSNTFLLRNSNADGEADVSFEFADGASPKIPLAGDWNQDGIDTVGVFDPLTRRIAARNANAPGGADLAYRLTDGTGLPLTGDWDYNEGDLLLAGHKQAYCWLDNQRVSGSREAQFANCNLRQGLTAGWADIYIRGLDCQWIDITGLAPGTYQLRVTVNTNRFIRESDYTNNVAIIKVRIPAPSSRTRVPEAYDLSLDTDRRIEAGNPVTFRWKVRHADRVTHQQLWLLLLGEDHDGDGRADHPGQTLLIDGDVAPDAREYRWVPTSDFAAGRARLLVRTQNDAELVGTDKVSEGTIKVVAKEANLVGRDRAVTTPEPGKRRTGSSPCECRIPADVRVPGS